VTFHNALIDDLKIEGDIT